MRSVLFRVALILLASAWFPTGSEGKARLDPYPSAVDWSAPIRADKEHARPVTLRHLIARGETLGRILSRYGIPDREARDWCKAASRKANLRRLTPGRNVDLSFVGSKLEELQFAIDDERDLVVTRTDDPQLQVRVESVSVQLRVMGARALVEGTFYDAAQQAGLPDAVISSMVDILGWKIDFNADVLPGDYFRVLYEHRVAPDGRPLKPGRVLAVDYSGGKRSAQAFLYTSESGEDVYLDADGKPLDRVFLRYPLEFTRISSTFSHSRFHPILHQVRPHEGVDFAAPSGTPVRAIGSGVVRLAGWKGGLGRTVEIDHGEGLVSVYGHLSDVRQSIRPGAKVARGDIVGSVGMSGLATGPHLHFGLFDGARYVNPLNMSGTISSVTKVNYGEFDLARNDLVNQLRSIPGSYRPAPSTPPVALSDVAQARQLGAVVLTL
jgi:murein DD-endopeptidase MepM/ murein hydrolase activator NlpD